MKSIAQLVILLGIIHFVKQTSIIQSAQVAKLFMLILGQSQIHFFPTTENHLPQNFGLQPFIARLPKHAVRNYGNLKHVQFMILFLNMLIQ